MQRKLLFFVLLLSLFALAMTACGGSSNESGDGNVGADATATPTPTPAPTPDPANNQPQVAEGTREAILAGIPNVAPYGYIATVAPIRPDANIVGGWTNPSTNAQARWLMFSGLSPMARNHFNDWFPNPIVSVGGEWPEVIDNADGTRTYRFTVYTLNQFSDGRYITAADYAGAIALFTSPQWAALVPSVGDAHQVVGRNAWRDGEADTFVGVRLYNDSQFSVTISTDYLPNVWAASSDMNWDPFPLHALGVEAHDDGNGVFITGSNRSPLTFEALNLAVNGGSVEYDVDEYGEIILGPDGSPVLVGGDGFRFNPTVFLGPYMFHSVDVGAGTLTVVANPYFPGTWDGFRPRIETVIWRHVPIPLIVDALADGEVHMHVGMRGGEVLQNAFSRLIDAPNPTHTFINYDQHGQNMIQFHSDYGPTQFRAVRQAMSHLIDRYAWNELVGRGFSTVPHGPYGASWWWYQEAMLRGLRDRLTIYDFNISRAIELLEADGWNYTATGDPFVGPGDGDSNIRHKWVDGELMPLEIRWSVTSDASPGRDYLNLQLPDNMAYAGMRLVENRYAAPFQFMQSNTLDRYNMFLLGIGKPLVWMPWWLFSPDQIPQSNWGQVDCPVVYEYSHRLRVVDITTPEGHEAFIEAFMDLMALLTYEAFTIPMSMARDHDFIPLWLGGWFNTGVWSFNDAIQRAYIRR